jgi:predicted dehydrogenase
MPSRRSFLKHSAAGTAALAFAAPAAGKPDRLPIALIGCGGMGTNHLKQLAARKDVEVRYVCEVDANRLSAATKLVEAGGTTPKPAKDLRFVLEDKQVVAVWIATPDHWHTPAAVLAADAGKHV